MRCATVFLVSLVLVPAAAGVPGTKLRIQVSPDGPRGASTTWTLRCAPSGGTLPRVARACRVLASVPAPFAPVPPDVGCTQIYGGPQEALVTGTFRGRRVWARFNRRDGCQIARWDRLRLLFPIPRGGA